MSVPSANMSLPIPSVGNTAAPTWGDDINASLTLVDQHDHSPGNGVQINPAGMNINTNLPFGGNFATGLAGLTLVAQGSTPAINTIYESGTDLYFVDGLGNNVRLTQSGAVAGTPGSIANLVAPASAAYVGGSSSFVWKSGTNIPANMDGGSVVIREVVLNGNGVTISAPTALAANYALTLMGALPASTKIVQIDSTGAVSTVLGVDNSTIEINSNNLRVKDAGITAAKLATDSVTISKLAAENKIVSSSCGGAALTSSYSDVTNLTCTITTTGFPVEIYLISDNNGVSPSSMAYTRDSTTQGMQLKVVRDSTQVSSFADTLQITGATIVTRTFWNDLYTEDAPAAGTYTYKIQGLITSTLNSGAGFVNNSKLVVKEVRS